MSNQIIKTRIPIELLFNFLKKICISYKNYYVLNHDSYKKAIANNYLDIFLGELIPYYFVSKQHYLTRPMNYNYFTTVIRQICKKNQTLFTSKIKYIQSSYDIVYYIYY